MRDQPMARPMRFQETLGNDEINILHFVPAQGSQDQELDNANNSDAIADWYPTPPRTMPDLEEGQAALEPSLKDVDLRAKEDSLGQSGLNPSKHCSITPSSYQPQRKQQLSSGKSENANTSLVFESPDHSSPRDAFGLKSMMSQIPSKQERAVAQQELVSAQEQMTTKMTDMMSNIVTSNRALELASKKEIASEELKHKSQLASKVLQHNNCLARGNMVVNLIRAGTSPADTQSITHAEFPDIWSV